MSRIPSLIRRAPNRAVVVCLAAAVVVLGVPTISEAATVPEAGPVSAVTETFGFVGPVTQTVVVPEGASSALVRAVGGKGGGTWPKQKKQGDFVTGGDGAQVSGTIDARPGEVLRVQVGEFGGDADSNINPGKGGWGGTGSGGRGGGSSNGDGAGGGGDTRLEIASCETCAPAPILVAGGGGGAGGVGVSVSLSQGGPGGSSGSTVDPGHNGKGLGAGRGGGSGGSGSANGLGGGNGNNAGGAGGGAGAGLRGGGGGGGGGTGGGGGGGGAAGSSYHWGIVQNPVVVRGATSDGNGLVVVTWSHVAAAACQNQTVQVPAGSKGVAVRLTCQRTGSATTFRIDSPPAHGSLVTRRLNAGTVTYVPRPGYLGTDSITFQSLTGAKASVPATVDFVVSRAKGSS
jgi:hypothetical protein